MIKDGPSSDLWIQELAKAETLPFQDPSQNHPQQLIEESAFEFLAELRDHCERALLLFNQWSEQGKKFPEIKIFSLPPSPANFMLFRNQWKLLFSHVSHGTIQIAFYHYQRSGNGMDFQSEKGSELPTVEIFAQMGPFKQIIWSFQGEKVEPQPIAQYYFTEFVKISRAPQKSLSTQHVTLEQIKALIHHQGLDL